MNLQPVRGEQIIVQREFMHTTQGIVWKVGGVTVKTDSFPAGVIKAGTAISVNGEGFAVPFNATHGNGYLLAVDVVGKGVIIAGAVMGGYADASKCTGITEAFKSAVKERLYFV